MSHLCHPCVLRGSYDPAEYYSLFFESIRIVTGPSFSKDTFISAPNLPVCTGRVDSCRRVSTNFSYKGMAVSGLAERMNEGRLPFFVLAKSVNWLTTINSPSMS